MFDSLLLAVCVEQPADVRGFLSQFVMDITKQRAYKISKPVQTPFMEERNEQLKKRQARRHAYVFRQQSTTVHVPDISDKDQATLDVIVDQLRRIPLCAVLSQNILTQIAMHMERVEYPAGSSIIVQGEPGDYFYVMLQGLAIVNKKFPDGDDQVVHKYDKAAYFGDLAVFHKKPRLASIIAQEDTVCYRLHGGAYHQIVTRARRAEIAEFLDFINSVPVFQNL
ncbi:hypothetical protein KIPB_011101, partial [Kipferlia bialata]|eukprot:g11101.t1